MDRSLVKTICYGIAIAMGVAVIVTNLVSPMDVRGLATLLAIGLALVGVAGLQK